MNVVNVVNVVTTFRLWIAALLCAVPLGWTWSSSITPGYTLYGDCGYSDGPYCTTDQYIPGSSSFTECRPSSRHFLSLERT